MESARQVRLQVEALDGDPEEAAEGTWHLKDEISRLDVDRVERAPAAPVPGAKGDPLAWAELVITGAGSLPALIGAVRSWVNRNSNCNVTLELDGDRLVLEGVGSEEQLELANAWLKRHGVD